MSFDAMAWVLKQEFARSSEKFVMVCMANYADERGYCYPSIAALERDTQQDRKTVMGNIARLIEVGVLRDTGRRIGATNQIPVYQLLGLPDASTVHYVYQLKNPDTGEYYVGKRSFAGDPEFDLYRGSGRWPRAMMEQGIPIVREIVAVFPTSEEAIAHERWLIRQADGDPLCCNEDKPTKHRARALQPDLFEPPGRVVSETVPKTAPFQCAPEQYQFSGETVPFFPPKGTKNGTRNQSCNQSTKPTTPSGEGVAGNVTFDQFWSAWPPSCRKVDKAKCLAIWVRNKYARLADQIIAHVELCKASPQWKRGYEPAPKTYLNGRRWLDGPPIDQAENAKPWYITWPGITAKGKEFGMEWDEEREPAPLYRERVFKRAGITAEIANAARTDFKEARP